MAKPLPDRKQICPQLPEHSKLYLRGIPRLLVTDYRSLEMFSSLLVMVASFYVSGTSNMHTCIEPNSLFSKEHS